MALFSKFLRSPAPRPERSRRTRLYVETLESRIVPYANSGDFWLHPQLVTISFVPDGTVLGQSFTGPVRSNLFANFNARFGSAATWQNVFLKAAQLWAQQTNINFAVVSDSGADIGAGSYQQGDSTFGDIRIGGDDFGILNNSLAGADMPQPDNNYSAAGDIEMNT